MVLFLTSITPLKAATHLSRTPKTRKSSSKTKKWSTKGYVEGRVGNKRNIGQGGVLTPLWQSSDKLFFSDARGMHDGKNTEFNIGGGFRKIVTVPALKEAILGVYGYFDRRHSATSKKYFSQASIGVELLSETWDARANVYVPLTGSHLIKRKNVVRGPYQYISETREIPYYGGDVEVGRSVPGCDQLRIYAAYYHFNAKNAKEMHGGRLRARYELTDHVHITAEVQRDNIRKTNYSAGLFLQIPLSGRKAPKLSALEKRMTEHPIRDIDLVTTEKEVQYPVGEVRQQPPPAQPDQREDPEAEQDDLFFDAPQDPAPEDDDDFVDARQNLEAEPTVVVAVGQNPVQPQQQGVGGGNGNQPPAVVQQPVLADGGENRAGWWGSLTQGFRAVRFGGLLGRLTGNPNTP